MTFLFLIKCLIILKMVPILVDSFASQPETLHILQHKTFTQISVSCWICFIVLQKSGHAKTKLIGKQTSPFFPLATIKKENSLLKKMGMVINQILKGGLIQRYLTRKKLIKNQYAISLQKAIEYINEKIHDSCINSPPKFSIEILIKSSKLSFLTQFFLCCTI